MMRAMIIVVIVTEKIVRETNGRIVRIVVENWRSFC
jgi:hypothetical protein